ncbi:AMP-binding protein [Roseiarcaceae bacterium H3SJ34-1]|uniref:class I adenylate-forming enzyme family protein n=1 Tax=Terripilifer ovatus TaxID=3032367 RepID=UPI003AB99ED5|nr:AMP-binding protein [Roseiarcaceae bacterium H3SJ34-1]
MNIAAILPRSANFYGAASAVAHGLDVHLTYDGLLDQVRRIAGGLKRMGLRKGDRIAFVMTNDPHYVALKFAAWWIGAVVVPINAKLHRKEVAHILADSGAALVFVNHDTAAVLTQLDGEVTGLHHIIAVGSAEHDALRTAPPSQSLETADAQDLAWLFYTSGTTGFPKGAMISHGNLYAMAQGYLSDVDSIAPQATLIHLAPMSHGSGFYTLPFLAMGGVLVVPQSGSFDEAEFFDLLPHWQEVSAFVAPTMMRRLTDHAIARKVDARHLRCMIYGGGPLYLADLQKAGDHFGPVFAQIYGQGECPMTITSLSRERFTAALAGHDETSLQSVGMPFLGTELQIRDADGKVLSAGATGEISVRSPACFLGYWHNETGTRAALQDGWLLTGDLGRIDAAGRLHLVGRSKETIISAGSNIYPVEIENVLLQHPLVIEAAVLGVPDAEWGESVAAFVAIEQETLGLEAELDALCLANIARFKRPRRYYLRPSLPKNAYGKILKRELLHELLEAAKAGR